MDQNNFQENNNTQQQEKQVKTIKKYGNRKLYDTQQSCYVILKDIEKMIRNNENLKIIDNETQEDITVQTLTKIIFGAENKSNSSAPADILQKIIRDGDGGFSSYLANLGLCTLEKKPVVPPKVTKPRENEMPKKKVEETSANTEEKLARSLNADESTSASDTEDIPQLPGSQFNL